MPEEVHRWAKAYLLGYRHGRDDCEAGIWEDDPRVPAAFLTDVIDVDLNRLRQELDEANRKIADAWDEGYSDGVAQGEWPGVTNPYR